MTRRRIAALVAAVACAVMAIGGTASADGSVAGSAGTDSSLPATDSAVTVSGRDQFSDLKVSVNQTKGLANQAISVTWTGGRPSTQFNSNWIQIFQCWGDDDGSVPGNPGPPPEQCEFGSEPIGNSQKLPSGVNTSDAYSRSISHEGWSTFDESQGQYDPDTRRVWRPFRAVDGTVIGPQFENTHTNSQFDVTVKWVNKYFAFTTTNEDPWELTYGDGKGAALFQVDTGLEAPGLGCGQKTQQLSDGSLKVPNCWLVIVPRGSPDEENPSNVKADPAYVATSPLSPTAWRNRIAVPLDVNPIDAGCTIGGDQRRIVGGELAARAVINWQPTLCGGEGARPFAFQAIGDDQGRRQVVGGAAGSAGMAIVTHPADANVVDPDNPLTYAPISLSGAVIGFNIERRPFDKDGHVTDQGEPALAGLRVTHINLTPRLVAKLLTQSYPRAFPSLNPTQLPAGYEWLSHNPENVLQDPDFVRFNPEFNVISVGNPQSVAGLITEGATTDVATEVWRWVLADPEAREWLAGTADQWGMQVNPYYSTDGPANPSGNAFGDPLPNTYPRNDPYCHQEPEDSSQITPRPLCMLDASPLALTSESAAQQVRAANDRATLSHDVANPDQQTSSTYWGTSGPQPTGGRSLLSLTDSASAARFGNQTASLSAAGDDGDGRSFVPPDPAALLKGVDAMKPSPDASDVLVPEPTAAGAGAYPLTMLTYGVVNPATLDAEARTDYGRFLTYAAGDGQTPGFKFGDLPAGYAPLPDALREKTKTAAASIVAFVPKAVDAEAAEEADGAVEEAARDGVADPDSVFSTDRPMSSLTMSDLITELTRPNTVPPPSVAILPVVAGGRTPKFVAGAIRFAVPFLFVLGALAVLLFLVFDTTRLRALVLRTERSP